MKLAYSASAVGSLVDVGTCVTSFRPRTPFGCQSCSRTPSPSQIPVSEPGPLRGEQQGHRTATRIRAEQCRAMHVIGEGALTRCGFTHVHQVSLGTHARQDRLPGALDER